jgi:hypothetical protein
MATYKLLEDYRDCLGPVSGDELRRAIRADYAHRVIDSDNYDELLSDVRDEELAAVAKALEGLPGGGELSARA